MLPVTMLEMRDLSQANVSIFADVVTFLQTEAHSGLCEFKKFRYQNSKIIFFLSKRKKFWDFKLFYFITI